MSNGELTVSAETLTRAFAFSMYALSSVSYWRLSPRLSSASRRLAGVMLAAQIVVIVVAIEIQPASEFEEWLWDLDKEWNIPSTFASVQLALVGGAALVTAWLARTRPAWQRLYLVGVGLVFLFLAWDEYFILHERILNWKRIYAVGGVVTAVATMAVAVRSPRHTWIWHLYLLVGLAISAAGAIFFELLSPACGHLGFLRLDGCLRLSFWEELLEFLGIWLTLVAMLGQFSDAAPMPKPRVRRFLYALPALWILLLFVNSLIPRLELRLLAQPTSVRFGTGVHLHGYRIDGDEEASVLWLYASARQRDYMGFGVRMGYSVHLVDPISGESAASHSEYVNVEQDVWLFAPGYAPIFRHRMEIDIPPQAARNRPLWVALTVWRKKRSGEYVSQDVHASDHRLLNETQVILGELVIPVAAAGQ